jgi:hypothetical protein
MSSEESGTKFGWCITGHDSDCIVEFADGSNRCGCSCHDSVDGPKEKLDVTEEEGSSREHTPEQGVDSSDGNAD